QLSDSSCAEELHAGASRLRFAPALETAFRRHHLTRMRVRTRTWGLMTAVAALTFASLQVGATGLLHPHSLLDLFLVPFSLLVAWLPWSRFYLTHYLQVARIAT